MSVKVKSVWPAISSDLRNVEGMPDGVLESIIENPEYIRVPIQFKFGHDAYFIADTMEEARDIVVMWAANELKKRIEKKAEKGSTP